MTIIYFVYCNVGKINKDYKTKQESKYTWVYVLFNQTINYLI